MALNLKAIVYRVVRGLGVGVPEKAKNFGDAVERWNETQTYSIVV
jgi:hypothetical protein